MRSKFALLIFGGIVAISGCVSQMSQTAPVKWGRKIVPKGAASFTSKTYGFAVWLPATPAESSGVSPLKNTGSVNFKLQTPSVNYVINFAPFSKAELSQPTAVLDQMQKGMVDSVSGQIQKVEKIQLNGFLGRETELTMSNGAIIFRGRTYLTPKGSYSIGVGGYKSEMRKQSKQINRVFDSFRFLPQ